ncbi:hypothetical protein SHAb15599_00011 [Acinetobacter phage SH-Ab 15599]|nr:hypothetical protein SHAb15599_00011 [Acinetobacter phage SH-Ab 15599]
MPNVKCPHCDEENDSVDVSLNDGFCAECDNEIEGIECYQCGHLNINDEANCSQCDYPL